MRHSMYFTLFNAVALLVGLATTGRTQAAAPQAIPEPQTGSAGTLAHAPAGFDAPREDIAHGALETAEYDSKTVGIKRKIVVYTPPGYRKDAQYPVLYLLPGIGQTEVAWTREAGAQVILDNLYADKKLVPMIVVMANGRASADPPPANPFDGDPFRTYGAFEGDLFQDLIPYVESHYPVKADREHRALAGLSMGGGQTLNIGLKHLDTFAWVGAFSSAPNTKPPAELVTDPAETARKLRLLWISCGDQDGLMHISRSVHDFLEEKGVPHIWHVDSGAHNWPVWQNDLYLLTPMLFRDAPEPTPSNAPPQGEAPGRTPTPRRQSSNAVSPAIRQDRRVTFRFNAPQAESVLLAPADMPGMPSRVPMTKSPDGVWGAAIGPVDPGASRYGFDLQDVP